LRFFPGQIAELNFIRRSGADERTKREDLTMRYFRLVVCAGILLLLSGAASAQEDYINIYAGGGPNNIPATTAPVFTPTNVAFDGAGNVYYSSQGGSNTQMRVWKITKSTGILTIVAGAYDYGYSGDGALAVNAELYNPQGIAIDHSWNIFIADQYNHIIREVNAGTGIITTIAGTPQSACSGASGCGITGPATSAKLYYPSGVAIDKNGNLFIANRYNMQIVMVSCATVTSTGSTCSPNTGQTAGDIYAVAGDTTGGYAGDGGPATSAELYYPYGIAVDTDGNLFITDTNNYRIREVSCGTGISGCVAASGQTPGDIYTIAGTATAGYNGDSQPATSAELYYPLTAAVDNSGNLFIADQDNYRIREVACVTTTSTGGACTASTGQSTGDIYTVAGDGSGGFTGDMGPATSATVSQPNGVAVDSAGDLAIADYGNNRIREVPCDVSTLTCTPPGSDTAKDIYTIAGTGATTYFGNGVPATGADLYYPSGVASDSSGNIYIADRSNCVVREVNGVTGIITTFAGSGTCGYSGDGGPATSADLNQPFRVAVDSSNNVYIADTANCLIRKVTSGTITTFAGKSPSLACGYMGDGGAATGAELYEPDGVAVDSLGNVYIADQYNYVIRKVSGGNITTFAGNHTYGFAGDGGPAGSAELSYVLDVATDTQGNVYIADQYNHRIRKVNASGIISTYAGNGTAGYTGDGGLAYETTLYYPAGVAVDEAGDVIIADYDNQRVRLVDESNIIHTIAGNGTAGFNGNDILATTAELYQPTGVAVDPSGNIYEADFYNWLVRKINALVILNSYPPSASFGTVSKGSTSDPIAITLSANGAVNIASITPSAGFKETDDCPSTLNSGQTCIVDVQFAPTTAGTVNGTLTISYPGFFAPSLVVPLQGTGTALTASPNPLAFGSQSISVAVTKTVTVKGATTYNATPAYIEGDTTDYTLTTGATPCTGTIASTCNIYVKFDPLSTGAKKATLVIQDNDPTSPQLVALTGTGSSYESFTPSTIAYKPQIINTPSTNTKVTFKYGGSGTLMLTSLVASPSAYTINYTGLSSGNCSAQPLALTMNQTCTFNVAFKPTATGATPGTVTANFTGDPNSVTQLVMNVTGTGTAVKITGGLGFGIVSGGTSKILSVTVTNEGPTALTFSPTPTMTGTGAGAYQVLPSNGTNSTCLAGGLMLAQNAHCTVTVQFNSPAGNAGAPNNATLSIFDNDPTSPQTVAATGKD
jgi:sugar lactone lactonase YvrE